MEKDQNNLEKKSEDDDSDDEDQKMDSNKSKKSEDKKDSEESKPAKFFAESKQNRTPDSDSEHDEEVEKENEFSDDSEQLSSEESGNLTETEVHEVILSIVDARMQEVTEEIENTPADSSEEYTAMSSAIFLEALAEKAKSDEDITSEIIDSIYEETVEDITLEITPDLFAKGEEDKQNDENNTEAEDITIAGDTDDEEEPTEEASDTDLLDTYPEPIGRTVLPISVESPSYRSPDTMHHEHIPKDKAPDRYEAYIPRSDMALGLIVGYILGRRGGRIRTEKRLKPEIKKLENQVAELSDAILSKEALVRKQSLQIYEKSFTVNDKVGAVIEQRKVRNQVMEQLKRRDLLLNDPNVEKIGKFSLPALKVFHERRLPDGNENSPKRVQVEVMTTTQLLEKIGDLSINNLSVKVMFESNRLKVEVLRQITKEYLRGGDYKKTFIRELLPDPVEIETRRSKVDEHHKVTENKFEISYANKNTVKNNQSTSSTDKRSSELVQPLKSSDKKALKPHYTAFMVIIVVIIAIMLLMSR